MTTVPELALRRQLNDRRQRLQAAVPAAAQPGRLLELLREVDAALERIDAGTYGRCEVCQDPIEDDRLAADPLVRFCVGDLTPGAQRALQHDLELAARIQRSLLPRPDRVFGGWEVHYRYEPAGPVSGDYCDVVLPDGDRAPLFFALGDISGKGVAASMLMANLQAIFRSLLATGEPLQALVERANRVFCESTLPTHYATLVCGAGVRGRRGRALQCRTLSAGPAARGRNGDHRRHGLAGGPVLQRLVPGPDGTAPSRRRPPPLHGRPLRGAGRLGRGVR